VKAILDQVRGQDKVIGYLLSAMKQKKLPHALLFVGPAGIGKKMVALGLTQALTCENNADKRACGQCPKCQRVRNEQSESLHLVKAVGDTIKVEQTRDILQFTSLKSLGTAQVVIIDSAHLMTTQAANSLLKGLEEPPENTYFILVTSNLGTILPTIRSRSQVVRFSPLATQDIREMSGLDGWQLAASQGSMERAENLKDGSYEELRLKAIGFVKKCFAGKEPNIALLHDFRELVREKDQSIVLAKFWQQLFRDARIYRQSIDQTIHADQAGLFANMEDISAEQLSSLSQQAFILEGEFKANRDRGLCLENFYFKCVDYALD